MKKSVFKKIVTCTLSAVLAATSFPVTAGIAANAADSAAAVSDVSVKSAKAPIRGDIDGNGIINVFDLIQMRKIYVDLTADNSAISGADIDGNGKIAINDLVMLAGYVAGKFSNFPDSYATTTTTTATTAKPVTTTTTTTQEEIDVPNNLYNPVDGINGYFVTDYKDGYEFEVYNTDYTKGSFFENHSGSDSSIVQWSEVENLRSTIRKRVPKQAPPISRISNSTASFYYYGSAYGDCFVGLHGWMQNNLCEYYIIDYYNGELPVGDAEFVNTVDIDGVVYDVYKGMKQDAPSIEGVKTFPVYYSVRSEQEHLYDSVESSVYCNVISHFRHWEASGLELGERLYDVSVIADCSNSDGILEFRYVEIDVPEVDANPEYTLGFVYENDANNTPDENGYFINEDFENGVGGFRSTTNGFGKTSTTESFSGNKSFMVERYNKTSAYAYLPINCVPGEKRAVNLMVMQNGAVSDTITLTLSYDLKGDIPCMSHYLLLDSVEAPKGEWVQLSYPGFKIPENAISAKLEISAEISDNSFYIDDVIVSQAVEIKPDENGYFINEDFEKGDGGFQTVTNNIGEICSTESFSGNNSFKVSDLFYSGAYACKKLECVPGEKRAVKLMAMQDEIENDTINLLLSYMPVDGYEMSYIELDSVSAPKGEWVQLSCPEFEIPEDASLVKLYISAEKTLYIDDVTVSAVK